MIEFLNADLEITSKIPLENVRDNFLRMKDSISEFSEMCCEPFEDGYFARFEVHLHDVQSPTSTELINLLCDSVEKLDVNSMSAWNSAERRVIDLGYESSDHCPTLDDSIPASTLKRMVDLQIDLAITIYPETIEDSR